MLGLLFGLKKYFQLHFDLDYFIRNDFDFYLLLITVGLISSGGYLVNDIFDVETDKVNKPEKQLPYSSNTRWIIYLMLNVFAATLTFYIAQNVVTIFILLGTIILLFFYSFIFQKVILIGNLIVAFLASILPFLFLVFYIEQPNKSMLSIIYFYSIMAFIVTLLREIVKDKEDEEGDEKTGYKTLAVLSNDLFLKYITISYLVISSVLFLFLIYIFNFGVLLESQNYFWIICALVYWSSLIFILQSKYNKVSSALKLTLFLGVLFLYF